MMNYHVMHALLPFGIFCVQALYNNALYGLTSSSFNLYYMYCTIVLTCQVCMLNNAHLNIRSNFGSVNPVYEN